MAAAENQQSWVDLQRMREERMRYEVLLMIYNAAEGEAGTEVCCRRLSPELGVWYAEVYRVIEYLARCGFLDYLRAGPVVSITAAGVRYIEVDAGQRKTIRNERGHLR